MKSRFRSVAVAAGATLALVIAGCGSSSGAADDSTSSQSPSGSVDSTQSAESAQDGAADASTGSEEGASASSGGAAPTDTISLTLGLVQGQDFVHAMPARVAEAQGMFAANGLDVKIVAFSAGSDLTKAMASGSVQAAAATGLDAVAATAKDVPLQAFFGVMGKSPMALMVPTDSSITGFADLSGKKVAISKLGSLTDYTLRAALEKVGIPLSDVQEIALGNPASTMSGMEHGDVDAFILPVNFGYALEAKGTGKVAQQVSDVLGDNNQFAILMANKDYVESDSEVLKRLAKTYTEAITWMQANKGGTVSLAESELKMDAGIADKTYDALVPTMTPDGALNASALAALADALPDLDIAKTVPEASEYLNTSIIGG